MVHSPFMKSNPKGLIYYAYQIRSDIDMSNLNEALDTKIRGERDCVMDDLDDVIEGALLDWLAESILPGSAKKRDEINALNDLLESGIISQDEYDKKIAQMMGLDLDDLTFLDDDDDTIEEEDL